ncbi:muramoyltetrapeptide carboxypeptidase LdcA involved in peptidoglycan recycling [Paenibacillus shirakamiensis]|uniref:Muramoyltetrapeptide carboxypeptidase LdcA involved in peptidoglycan recycling n=1 Tax=Paenibacillus shirakamiensis TaxID=1265935 RepID=A0ABS4JC59_9BACL|nr:S66 peptidase family protein [Paenibacillus shirakamiensis]MBP1999288.1 muramoyltetrapeptide carboxypeptidase LdcA involved in peptidoglycan recycling [Paenibacillus shirakamiensis]
MKYPLLEPGATIGITASSSGVKPELHDLLHQTSNRLRTQGFNVIYGDTVWNQHKSTSAPALVRASEFNEMMLDDDINIIIPPWGGELLIEILEYVDFEHIPMKWILGYSDISLLLLAITLKTGIATAHGTNVMDLRGEFSDPTTAMWLPTLSTRTGEAIRQHSSLNYQKEWNFNDPSPSIFHLTEPTFWKIISQASVNIQGRLLGGCIDVIRHVIGTPYGDVQYFQQTYIHNEPILWYLENCELSTTDLRRTLVQMKLAGWFEHCSGIMFGRSEANQPFDGYTVEDVYTELSNELKLPIIYDIDCGHLPPQNTLINGAWAEVHVEADGTASVTQYFRP